MKNELSTTDRIQFKTLQNGNPVSLRTRVDADESSPLKNGQKIKVTCDDDELDAIIISDPIPIVERPEDGSREVSIEVRKLQGPERH